MDEGIFHPSRREKVGIGLPFFINPSRGANLLKPHPFGEVQGSSKGLMLFDEFTLHALTAHPTDPLIDVIGQVDVITINDEEARQLTGEYSLVRAADKISRMGPDYVVIKKGENGALLFHEQQIFFAPALPLEEVFDPTGAGDTFAGGFAGYLAETQNFSFQNMKNAVIHGSNLASFCVERFGTERLLDLKPDEMEARLRQFRELTQFDFEVQ